MVWSLQKRDTFQQVISAKKKLKPRRSFVSRTKYQLDSIKDKQTFESTAFENNYLYYVHDIHLLRVIQQKFMSPAGRLRFSHSFT